jgi:hypothetical protein
MPKLTQLSYEDLVARLEIEDKGKLADESLQQAPLYQRIIERVIELDRDIALARLELDTKTATYKLDIEQRTARLQLDIRKDMETNGEKVTEKIIESKVEVDERLSALKRDQINFKQDLLKVIIEGEKLLDDWQGLRKAYEMRDGQIKNTSMLLNGGFRQYVA